MINKFLKLALCLCIIPLSSCSSDDDNASGPITIVIEGATIEPEIGGSNEQNQVYVDLSTSATTVVQRDSWDLGFYSGSDFRVAINGSIYMATAALSSTDINSVNSTSVEVQELQPQVAVGTFDAENIEFVDAPYGQITETAIENISETDESNPVYLVNLGFEVGTEAASTGSVAVAGDARGWKKIRVLRNDDDYVLQYADLDDTTYQEVNISKNSSYNFTFFSFNTENEVNVEPIKNDWDLNFTVFTNEIEGYGSYGYSDFVVTNTKGGALSYMIDTETTDYTYDNFTLANITNIAFDSDQRNVGSSWRNGGGPDSLPTLKDNVFYIVNDSFGNYYKVQFLALTNEAGERGHPKFIYSLLQ
ncbi:HmuY family protein [Winogradskyella wichelsiae]|uniref:HmuY family protein n=1 Tax=Winogradskyella wichelsiae TaxID=2697007 RepID=UPI0015CA7DD7|nr:HmuY family protein [Winogradskyella wichelsiae]